MNFGRYAEAAQGERHSIRLHYFHFWRYECWWFKYDTHTHAHMIINQFNDFIMYYLLHIIPEINPPGNPVWLLWFCEWNQVKICIHEANEPWSNLEKKKSGKFSRYRICMMMSFTIHITQRTDCLKPHANYLICRIIFSKTIKLSGSVVCEHCKCFGLTKRNHLALINAKVDTYSQVKWRYPIIITSRLEWTLHLRSLSLPISIYSPRYACKYFIFSAKNDNTFC